MQMGRWPNDGGRREGGRGRGIKGIKVCYDPVPLPTMQVIIVYCKHVFINKFLNDCCNSQIRPMINY